MLQRVPPDMRILTPGLRFFSSSRTRRPASAARIAAINPAAPAPITTTSQNASGIVCSSSAPDLYEPEEAVHPARGAGILPADTPGRQDACPTGEPSQFLVVGH